MSPALGYWTQNQNNHYTREEWNRDKKRRISSEYSPQQTHNKPIVWETKNCNAEPIPSVKEQLLIFNTDIDDIYDQLAVLIAKRDAKDQDLSLEDQIVQLSKRLEKLQKQAGDLNRATFASPPTGAIAIGLAILEDANELRAKYGNITPSTKTPNHPNTATS